MGSFQNEIEMTIYQKATSPDKRRKTPTYNELTDF